MDNLCIDLGTLLDRPDIKTLEGPEQHSLHWYVQGRRRLIPFAYLVLRLLPVFLLLVVSWTFQVALRVATIF
jgi:hypothetical protein